jgi:acyl-CoA synthetase (AMP-forming)/AMP-acid ligase II
MPPGSALLPPEFEGLPATIPAVLGERADIPDDEFVIGPDFRLTFGEADSRSAALAARLMAAGVGKGTRVGLLYPNSPEWIVTWLALARIGALSVPLSTFAPGPELAGTIRLADVQALLMGDRFAGQSMSDRLEIGLPGLAGSGPELALVEAPYLRWVHIEGEPTAWSRQLPPPLSETVVRSAQGEVSASDPLAIISTSGATAAPKAVVHTQGSLVRHAALLIARRGLTRVDRVYSPMPFFWVGGLTMVLLAALCSGAAAVVQERFEPGEALELIERERATQISCWPNAARQMAEHPTFPARELGSIRGGTLWEALPAAARPARPDLAPIPLGMTETGGPHTGPDDAYAPLGEELRGSVGRSLPGMEHRIVDTETATEVPCGTEGEIELRGVFLMEGFYKRERHATFTADGWYATGDLGWFGADGHLRFVGRRTAMIKTGGSNVSPAEVEAALTHLPGVESAYVFGIPAGDRGEDVAAVVVPLSLNSVVASEIPAAMRAALSTYKIPRHYRVVMERDLPKLPTGKVDLVSLRGLFADGTSNRN